MRWSRAHGILLAYAALVAIVTTQWSRLEAVGTVSSRALESAWQTLRGAADLSRGTGLLWFLLLAAFAGFVWFFSTVVWPLTRTDDEPSRRRQERAPVVPLRTGEERRAERRAA